MNIIAKLKWLFSGKPIYSVTGSLVYKDGKLIGLLTSAGADVAMHEFIEDVVSDVIARAESDSTPDRTVTARFSPMGVPIVEFKNGQPQGDDWR